MPLAPFLRLAYTVGASTAGYSYSPDVVLYLMPKDRATHLIHLHSRFLISIAISAQCCSLKQNRIHCKSAAMQQEKSATGEDCLHHSTKLRTYIERILQLLCKAVAFEVNPRSLDLPLLSRLLQAFKYSHQVLLLRGNTQCSKHDFVAVAKGGRKADQAVHQFFACEDL